MCEKDATFMIRTGFSSGSYLRTLEASINIKCFILSIHGFFVGLNILSHPTK